MRVSCRCRSSGSEIPGSRVSPSSYRPRSRSKCAAQSDSISLPGAFGSLFVPPGAFGPEPPVFEGSSKFVTRVKRERADCVTSDPQRRGSLQPAMARDDWRIRIELEGDRAEGFLERIGLDLGSRARELAKDLEEERLPVSRDGDTIFVYASSRMQAEQAFKVVKAELEE